MSYVNINTLEKVEALDIIRAYPEVSFPNRGWNDEELAPYGYAELWYPNECPTPGLHEKLEETDPVKIDGKWYIQFQVVSMTEEELELEKEAIKQKIVNQVQYNLDLFARSRDYDSILSLCTYATSPSSIFQREGQRGVDLRDASWTKLYEIFSEVDQGTRPPLTGYHDISLEMPILTWDPVE